MIQLRDEEMNVKPEPRKIPKGRFALLADPGGNPFELRWPAVTGASE
ncbi:MAG: hypothetical protein L3K13_01245 [Thermoplasmata archaeon]|nr:hypothetical protein [Thermoplasmata archaeon]